MNPAPPVTRSRVITGHRSPGNSNMASSARSRAAVPRLRRAITMNRRCALSKELAVYPFTGSSYRGPDPAYAKLRVDQPVVKVHTEGGVDAWLVTRYEDVRSLSADPRLS